MYPVLHLKYVQSELLAIRWRMRQHLQVGIQAILNWNICDFAGDNGE